MNKHPDCEDVCQLKEHKGYTPCDYSSGVCAYLDTFPAAPLSGAGAAPNRSDDKPSGTPRTDVRHFQVPHANEELHIGVVLANFARQLERELARSKSGECLKCGIGPRRETCAYPEACEHPGRVAALECNQALIAASAHWP